MIDVTTAIVQDKRILKKDGTYAIKLRITHNRQQYYFPINVWLKPEDWMKTQVTNPRKEFKEHKLYFNQIEAKANGVIRNMNTFSLETFKKKFNQKSVKQNDAFQYFYNYINNLNEEGRSGTAASYLCAVNSIRKFNTSKNRKKLPFSDITPKWLEQYESWMLSEGKSITSIGIYLRSLRTIINLAIEDSTIQSEHYPFGKRKYQIPAGQNIKKALTIADIKKIVEYQPKSNREAWARDMWLLSYLSNGINMQDIFNLKYENIKGNKITFIRAKTKRSSKQNLKKVNIILIPEIETIIEKWGVKPKNPKSFIFGIIEDTDDPRRKLAKSKQAIKNINKYTKKIGAELGIEIPLTTYVARHSFATILKRSGAPIEFISESLGHQDLRTTENYLDSFEDETKEKYQRQLLNFENDSPK